ncbi:MAG: heavy metal-binding domain-containing protein, partial [Anaerolineales bacterium]
MDSSMTSTAFTIEGYRIVRNLGVVRGITVRSRSVLGNFAGGIQTLFGGNITIFTELCEHARLEAFQLLLGHAQDLG